MSNFVYEPTTPVARCNGITAKGQQCKLPRQRCHHVHQRYFDNDGNVVYQGRRVDYHPDASSPDVDELIKDLDGLLLSTEKNKCQYVIDFIDGEPKACLCNVILSSARSPITLCKDHTIIRKFDAADLRDRDFIRVHLWSVEAGRKNGKWKVAQASASQADEHGAQIQGKPIEESKEQPDQEIIG